jgi:hypothetical protein
MNNPTIQTANIALNYHQVIKHQSDMDVVHIQREMISGSALQRTNPFAPEDTVAVK